MEKHILVISQYYYPENFRIVDICEEWVKRGYKVTVITGIPNYPKGKFYKGYGLFKKRKEIINGVSVKRLLIVPRGKRKLTLLLNYLSFVLSGYRWKLFTRIKADLVFTFEVSPMTQALLGVWYSKKRKIPNYLYVQDLWPENLEIIGGVKNKLILNKVNKMVAYIYRHSTKILVTSNSFKNNIESRGVSKNKLVYWPQYAEEFYKPITSKNKDKQFNVIFTGNIGQAQGLEILPKLAIKLKEDGIKNLNFTLIGDGRNKQNIIDDILELNVESYFKFIEQQNPKSIPKFLAKADVAFLSFSNNALFEMTIPAKLQSYMACAKPIYAVASGETKAIIEEASCGLVSKPDDIEKAYKNLQFLYYMSKSEIEILSNNALNFYQKHFNKKILLDQLEEIFNDND